MLGIIQKYKQERDTRLKLDVQTIENCFPFASFRANQKKILNDVKQSLEGGNDIAIIEGPTGFGKSPVNIALGKYFKPAFYTTPQIKLVNQIARDFGPEKLVIDGGKGAIIPLLGRNNYICRASGKKSDECSIRENPESGCKEEPKCTYWVQKQEALQSDIAIITFAMLIVNNYLSGDSHFEKRDLLIVDECQSLESQVASMFAGFSIAPYSFPKSMRKALWEDTLKRIPDSKDVQDYVPFFREFQSSCLEKIPFCLNAGEREKLLNLTRKIDYMRSEMKEDRKWVVNIIERNDYFKGKSRQFKPISIDGFLRRKVWPQAEKIILSSATIPFRTDTEKWLKRIGLGKKKYSFHSAPMTFPISNRPIITSYMGGKMTHRNERDSWKDNIENIKEIIKLHENEKGVIHTHSYKRANRLFKDLKGYSVYLHEKDKISSDIVQEWIKSKKLILLSPSIKEGADLKDDLCRYQILIKIPFPSIGDARVKFLLMERNQWTWYFDETAKDIIQEYGRAVRSETDHAKFYIVDGSFDDVYKKASFPKWFEEAIN